MQCTGQELAHNSTESVVPGQCCRFDFNLSRGMSAEEVSRVEALVNSWVGAASDVQTRVMALDDARAAGATAMFGEKYDDVVRVVDVPGVSMELCGGESSLGVQRGRFEDIRCRSEQQQYRNWVMG